MISLETALLSIRNFKCARLPVDSRFPAQTGMEQHPLVKRKLRTTTLSLAAEKSLCYEIALIK